tara:strand:- start:307 stop:825 length:519 start_codon:yes stop_codon:yes gene_type:complete
MIDSVLDFLEEAIVALGLTLLVIIFAMIWVFGIGKKSLKVWISKEGKGAIASAALGVVSIIGIAAFLTLVTGVFASSKANAASDMFTEGTWFNETSVFLGIDSTLKVSPQCVEGGTDDRLTSNLGIRQNIWRSQSKVHDITFKYTHHSCVFGKDRNGYDGFGLEYNWYIFRP